MFDDYDGGLVEFPNDVKRGVGIHYIIVRKLLSLKYPSPRKGVGDGDGVPDRMPRAGGGFHHSEGRRPA